MTTKHVNVNPKAAPASKYKAQDSEPYLDWREVLDAGLVPVPDSLDLEDKIRRFMDATALKREAEDILGTTYKPALSKELTETLTKFGLMRLEYLGMRFAVQSGKQSRVSPELLLAHGVSPDTINACTEVSEYTFTVMRSGRK